jgi:putative Mg2+ transporter-C (MgtC) family protein
MDLDFFEMAIRIVAALAAGAFIGYERSYRGRPARFRTHALVCMASSMLMLITVYEAHRVHTVGESVRLDPTRMAQGIMTGIGFLGAGVIMQEGFSVRGLTTASASGRVTAAAGEDLSIPAATTRAQGATSEVGCPGTLTVPVRATCE